MDCTTFQARLEEFLDGSLSADERRAAETHLATCRGCRELRAVMGVNLEFLSLDPPAGLAESILARTSGSRCGRARDLLGDHVDGTLEGIDRDLLGGHLDHCRDCAALASALVRLTEDLPGFAELGPDPRFADDVLAATRPRRRAWADVWGTLQSWNRLFERPRIAWEAGYIGAMVLWLVFGASWSPLRAAPSQALAVVQQNPVEALALGSGTVDVLSRRVATVGDRAAQAVGGRAIRSARAVGSALADPYRRAAQHWDDLRQAARELDFQSAVEALKSLSDDARALWDRVRMKLAEPATPPDRETR